MKTRREFITLFGGAVAAAWPLGAHSQPTPLPLIGFLNSGSPAAYRPQLAGFHQGLRELGFNEGQNVTIEYRWADGEYERLPELASDLVGRKVAIIVATGGSLVGRIAKAAT